MLVMLPRFYDITDGSILVDGVGVRDYKLDALRQKFAVVLQKAVLFQDTVSGNIAWGNPNADPEAIKMSAKTAQADGFLSDMPEGYETQVAAGGVSLSGGQRQLLSIARAFVADPDILILDEATSNVDTRTEKKIQAAMQNLMKDRTSIVIAHRLSTIQEADLIVVMDHGSIVEMGTHRALLAKKGTYYDLYMTQFAGFAT